MGAKNFYQRILQKFQTKSEISVMETKDLCLQLLQKMNIEVHVNEEKEDHYYFEYMDQILNVRMNNECNYIFLYDTFWRKFPTNNLEMVSIVRKTVNEANIRYFGFKLLYTFDEDTMWIHSNTCELLIPEIPDLERYFKETLDSFLFSHKAFDDTIFEQMKEEGNK